MLLIRTLFSYVLIGLLCLVVIPPCLAIACLPARYRYDNAFFFYLFDCLYKGTVRCSFSSFVVRGVLATEPAIIVANHQSSLDIPVVGALCNRHPHVWFALSYYVRFPVLGFFIRRMFVSVDRDVPVKAARSLLQVYRSIKSTQRHLIIFPEGSRFIDGKIHPFFEGFAMLAKKTGRPVVPIWMPNNGKIYPPYSFYIYRYPVLVEIGESMYHQEGESDKEFTERVRTWFVGRT